MSFERWNKFVADTIAQRQQAQETPKDKPKEKDIEGGYNEQEQKKESL